MKGFIESALPVIIIVILALAAVGSTIMLNNAANPASAPTPTILPIPSIEQSITQPLQLSTFYLDEYNQPLFPSNAKNAINRNQIRIETMTRQIDSDITLVDELQKAL